MTDKESKVDAHKGDDLSDKFIERPRCNGRDGDFRLAAMAKIKSLQEQLTTTQQALDRAVEALKSVRDLLYSREFLWDEAAILVKRQIEAALASIKE